MTTPKARLLPAAAIGLAAGLLLAAVYLGFVGYRALHADATIGLCSTPELVRECALEREIATGVARLQLYSAVGLTLLATAVLLAVRARARSTQPPDADH